MQLFHLIFTEPGKRTLAHPCTILFHNLGGNDATKAILKDKRALTSRMDAGCKALLHNSRCFLRRTSFFVWSFLLNRILQKYIFLHHSIRPSNSIIHCFIENSVFSQQCVRTSISSLSPMQLQYFI